jgi:hypothetical protein
LWNDKTFEKRGKKSLTKGGSFDVFGYGEEMPVRAGTAGTKAKHASSEREEEARNTSMAAKGALQLL